MVAPGSGFAWVLVPALVDCLGCRALHALLTAPLPAAPAALLPCSFSLAWCGGGVCLQGLHAVVAACPRLQAFSISSDQQAAGLASVGDAFVAELAQRCPHITALELSDTSVRAAGADGKHRFPPSAPRFFLTSQYLLPCVSSASAVRWRDRATVQTLLFL